MCRLTCKPRVNSTNTRKSESGKRFHVSTLGKISAQLELEVQCRSWMHVEVVNNDICLA